MTNICKELFRKLNVEKIRYYHFKRNEHLEEGLDGKKDLDILVDDNQYSFFVNILVECGFKEFEPNEFCKYPGVTNWYGLDKESGVMIHLHLHTHLITGKSLIKDYAIPREKEVLDNAEIHPCCIKINTPGIV